MKHDPRVTIFWLLCLSLLPFHAFGQLAIRPIPLSQTAQKPVPNASFARSEQDSMGTVQKLTVPFFDDFSTNHSPVPDTLRWITNGAHINNTLSANPPSFNFATFDGADLAGNAYADDAFSEGDADFLSSRPFDLFSFGTNRLAISFYWQAGGLGEQPDASDSFRLEFKNSDGNWETVWEVFGDTTPVFRKETVNINQTRYLHREFQFRFYSYGRLSGGFDAWHLDYVYLYDRQADNPSQRLDVALARQPSSLLRRYRAMPAIQFFANMQGELADTVYTSIQHLADTFNVISHRSRVRELYNNLDLGELGTGSIGQNTSFSGTNIIRNNENMLLAALTDSMAMPPARDSLLFETTFFVNSNETNRIIPTRNNDTLRHLTHLNDYYAYDDGTAEYGIGIMQAFGQVAYRFELNVADRLTDIDINFVRLGDDIERQPFVLMVWEQVGVGVEEKVLLRQNVLLRYPDSLNAFERYTLSRPIELPRGVFYIGYQQISDQRLTVGYDLNSESGNHILYNVSAQWVQNTQFTGSMMLRPVFRKIAPVTSTRNSSADYGATLSVYPVPAKNEVYLEGPIKLAVLYGVDGKQLGQQSFNGGSGTHVFRLGSLPAGIYLLRLTDGKSVATKKIVVSP